MVGIAMQISEADRERDILGVRVKALNWPEILDEFDQILDGIKSPRIVNFLNAHNANQATLDGRYRDVLTRSVVLPDGIGVDIASKALHGSPFPANLNGTDLVPALLVHTARPLRVALIGARPEVLELAAAGFRKATPWHEFHAVAHGYFDRDRPGDVLDRLAALEPDLTLVAMGSPIQEIWIDTHMRPGHGRLVMGVGALFDFVSGIVPRAPEPVRNLRLEWLFRLSLEPSRLWRRYVVGNPVFLYRVIRYKIRTASRQIRATA